MDNREFFNDLAYKWDGMCHHDEEKLKKIISISQVKSEAKILDVGTGTGVMIPYLLKCNPEKITAVDISENMIKVAKSKFKDSKVEFLVQDLLSYEEKDFDYVFLYSVYPHFTNKSALFFKIQKLLKHGGKIVIAHSQSKEKINQIHKKSEAVKEHMLLSAEDTAKKMSNYFNVNKIVDNNEMYYISALK